MECPYCGSDMDQLVSLDNVLDPETNEMDLKVSKHTYERCHECGHEVTIDLEVFDGSGEATEKEKQEE